MVNEEAMMLSRRKVDKSRVQTNLVGFSLGSHLAICCSRPVDTAGMSGYNGSGWGEWFIGRARIREHSETNLEWGERALAGFGAG